MMKFLPGNLLRFVYSLILLIAVCAAGVETAYAQKQAVKKTGSGLYYLEYLPDNYKSSGEKFPVIIFLHGLGERGNGAGAIHKVKKLGPPKHIENGHNMTFKANGSGKRYSFVVISPQLPTSKGQWSPSIVDGVVSHVLKKYNIDKDRVYLTGLSLGGGGVWSYVTSSYNKSHKIAAIAPVAGFLSSGKSRKDTKFLADKKVPVWAFHNKGDRVVPLSHGKRPIDGLKRFKPSVAPRFTVYNSNSHNSWSSAYATNHSRHSPNVYEWLLAQKRGGSSDSSTPDKNEAPVADAGDDVRITLPTSTTILSGGQSKDEDGSIKKYYWKKVSGPSASIVSSRSSSTKIKNLKEGNYVFELQVTDNKGASDKDQVKIAVIKKKEEKKDKKPVADNDGDKGGSDDASSAAVRINFNELSENNASGWNNLNFAPKANHSRSNLKNVNNKNTGISIKLLTSWNDSNDRGYSTKNNAAVYPDKVISSYFYTTGTERIQISGLDKNTTYKFSFYASSWFGGNRTAEYSIGSRKTSLDASYNKNNVATLSGIRSNSKGQVTLVVKKAKGARYGFLGAIIIDPKGGAIADNSKPSDDKDDASGDSSDAGKTADKAVRVNFNELSENDASGWNNLSFAPKANHSRSNLKDIANKNTGISIKLLTSWNDSNDRGYSTKNNSAVYPDKVISSYFYTTGTEKIQISGLDKNTTYTFSFYASSWFSGNRTAEYSIGSKKTSLNASYNKNNVATLSGIRSNSKGQVTLVVKKAKGARYGFLGAMIIEPQSGSHARKIVGAKQTKGTEITKETTTAVEEPGTSFVEVNAYPNPVTDVLSVEMFGEEGEVATIALVDALGRIIYTEEKTMSGFADTFEIDVNALGLKPGLVFLQVNSSTYGEEMIKLIKK